MLKADKKNWRAIGNRFVAKVRDQALIPLGFAVEVAKPLLYFVGPGNARTKKEDIFKAFDIYAVHGQEPPFNWLIQCTVGGGPRVWERKQKIIELAEFLSPDVGQKVQIWQRDSAHKQLVHVFTYRKGGRFDTSELEFPHIGMEMINI